VKITWREIRGKLGVLIKTGSHGLLKSMRAIFFTGSTTGGNGGRVIGYLVGLNEGRETGGNGGRVIGYLVGLNEGRETVFLWKCRTAQLILCNRKYGNLSSLELSSSRTGGRLMRMRTFPELRSGNLYSRRHCTRAHYFVDPTTPLTARSTRGIVENVDAC